MIFRPNQDAINDYFGSPIISQSRLKLLPKGVESFNNIKSDTDAEIMFYEEKSYFLIGQAAELKAQQGIEIFQNNYHCSEVPKPSDKVLSIISQIFDIQARTKEPSEPFPLLSSDEIYYDIKHAIEYHEYYPKWGMDVKVNKIKLEGESYYNDLIVAFGKQILSLDETTIVNSIVNSWTTNNRMAHYFQEIEGIDIYYQLPIYFEYLGIEFKALIDILEVNHNAKTIKVIDLKTFGGYTINFPSSVRKFRYDFQVAFYCLAANWWKKNARAGILSEYKILNPEFVVESTKPGCQGNPLVFTVSNSLMNIALFGRKLFSKGEYVDDRNMTIKDEIQTHELYGIIDTVNLYRWHSENGFEKDQKVHVADSANKSLRLDWEGVIEA